MAENALAMREKQFNIRFSDEEVNRLDTLADHYGLNGAAVIRMLIKKDFDAVKAAATVDRSLKRGR